MKSRWEGQGDEEPADNKPDNKTDFVMPGVNNKPDNKNDFVMPFVNNTVNNHTSRQASIHTEDLARNLSSSARPEAAAEEKPLGIASDEPDPTRKPKTLPVESQRVLDETRGQEAASDVSAHLKAAQAFRDAQTASPQKLSMISAAFAEEIRLKNLTPEQLVSAVRDPTRNRNEPVWDFLKRLRGTTHATGTGRGGSVGSARIEPNEALRRKIERRQAEAADAARSATERGTANPP